MKVLVIQDEGESRDQLVSFLETRGAEVVTSRLTWPGFFHIAKDERPDVAVVDCSPEPGYGREVAGYLGETAFTNQIIVFAVNVPQAEVDRLKRRAPNARPVSLHELERELKKIDPEFGEVSEEDTDESS